MSEVKTKRPFQERFLDGFDRSQLRFNLPYFFVQTLALGLDEWAVDNLMGTKADARFRFIQERAAFADNLDI